MNIPNPTQPRNLFDDNYPSSSSDTEMSSPVRTPPRRIVSEQNSSPGSTTPLIFKFSPPLEQAARRFSRQCISAEHMSPSIGQTLGAALRSPPASPSRYQEQRGPHRLSSGRNEAQLAAHLHSIGARYNQRFGAISPMQTPPASHAGLMPSASFDSVRRTRPQTPYARPLPRRPARAALVPAGTPSDISPLQLNSSPTGAADRFLQPASSQPSPRRI